MTMRPEQRAVLSRLFDEAEELGLEPVWHEDYSGFAYKCPSCEGEGKRHLVTVAAQPVLRFDPPVP